MRAPRRRPTKVRSAREIARHADRILEEAAAKTREFEKQGLRSVTIPRVELIRKLSGLYSVDALAAGVVLERGSLSVAIA